MRRARTTWLVSVRKRRKKDGSCWQLFRSPPKGLVDERGKPIRGCQLSSGTEDRAEAEAIAKRMQDELNRLLMRDNGSLERLTFREVFDLCISAGGARGSGKPTTLEKYQIVRDHLDPHLGHIAEEEMTRGAIIRARDALSSRVGPKGKLTNQTVNQYLRLARAAWGWALRRGFVSKPWPKFEKLPETDTEKRPFTEDEARRFFEAVKSYRGGWLFPFYCLLWHAGSRVTETAHLRERDIDRTTGSVEFISTKGGKRRTAFVDPEILALIRLKDPDEFLFVGKRKRSKPLSRRTITGATNRILRELGLDSERLDTHSMRRTWITAALRTPGVSMVESMKFVGHTSMDTHLGYQRRALDDLKQTSERVRRHRSFVPGIAGSIPQPIPSQNAPIDRGSSPANPGRVTPQSHTPLSCCRASSR